MLLIKENVMTVLLTLLSCVQAGLPCVEVEATKEHHGDDEDRSDGEGDVGTGGDTGEEVAERHDHLEDQEGDTQEDEEPLSLRV